MTAAVSGYAGGSSNTPTYENHAGHLEAVKVTYDPAKIQFELPGDEAWALAQFVKRVGWTEMRENAESEDETYLIRSALSQLADALRDQGYAPR